MGLAVVLAAVAVATLGVVSPANATHPRPDGATPLRVSMVPAYDQCTAPNREHGPPLVFESCNPAVESSSAITVGTPDANGAVANSDGFVKNEAIVGVPGPPDDSDILLSISVTDVRCKVSTTACGSANAGDGPDYTGEVQGNVNVRITDHFNAVAAGGGTDPATVVDIPYPTTTPCAATASTAIGATCSVSTSANAAVPGSVKDGKRFIMEFGQRVINDGGSDGVVNTSPNSLFEVQGLWVP